MTGYVLNKGQKINDQGNNCEDDTGDCIAGNSDTVSFFVWVNHVLIYEKSRKQVPDFIDNQKAFSFRHVFF